MTTIPLIFISVPPLLRTTVIVRNRFPQANINVQKSCKTQHVPNILCYTHLNDKIIDFLYVDENPMKIDEKLKGNYEKFEFSRCEIDQCPLLVARS